MPIEAVIEHNRLEVEATGERHFLRDRGLLETAVARPRNFFSFGEEDRIAEEEFVEAIRPFVVGR